MQVCGIDEAGRGPALGPLVICGISIDESKVKLLEDLGVNDSKQLTAKRREELFDSIVEIVDSHHVISLEPLDIDNAMRSETSNLNQLEFDNMANVIIELKPNKVIVDCCDPKPDRLKALLQEKTGVKDIISEHKAERYAVVAAASIIAKVTRDRSMRSLVEELGIDFGSGYGSDPKTQNFLEENWKDDKFSKVIRKEWGSYKRLAEAAKQQTLGNF